MLLAVRGETYGDGQGRTKDLVIGAVSLIYAIWLVYAGGLEYLLTGAVAYARGQHPVRLGPPEKGCRSSPRWSG